MSCKKFGWYELQEYWVSHISDDSGVGTSYIQDEFFMVAIKLAVSRIYSHCDIHGVKK